MYVNLKNKYLMSMMIFLSSFSCGSLSAEPKTWSKDENGRVLVYRAEPSKAVAVIFTITTAMGLGLSSIGFLPEIPAHDRLPLMLTGGFLGSIISIPSAYVLSQWYHNYSSLFKPLIIMDRSGITYEGKDKILWKKVCGYREMVRTIYHGDGIVTQENYLEIITDVNRSEIYERDIAITLPMLYKLIDETYKLYQKLEKENIAVIA